MARFADAVAFEGSLGSLRTLDHKTPDHPARRLMAAVLADAIDVHRHGAPPGRGGRTLAFETTRWFASEDRTWPYSYRNVCDALGIDALDLRARLKREQMALVPRRPKDATAATA